MTSAADRIAAIRERLPDLWDRIRPSHAEDVLWLADRYEDALRRLERIGPPAFHFDDTKPCRWCNSYSTKLRRLADPQAHLDGCPWRSAREHLEAE